MGREEMGVAIQGKRRWLGIRVWTVDADAMAAPQGGLKPTERHSA
jgi:hypothetical protein